MLDSQELVNAQVLTKQISDTFGELGRIADKVKGGRLSQQELTCENEVAVALLTMLGSNCEDITRRRQSNVLQVAYAHFDSLRRQLDKDSAFILKDWISYMDSALLSKPLTKLQITRSTLERAEAYMIEGGGLQSFMGSFLGAAHDKADEAQHARDNADTLRARHRAAIEGGKAQYMRRQKDKRRCPTQNEMYRVSGGSRGKDLVPALLSSRKKMDAMYALQSGMGGAKEAMHTESDEEADDGSNAVVITLNKKLKRRGKTVSIKFPFPCQVLEQINSSTVGVRLAAPFNDIDVAVSLTNLERRPSEVSAVEQSHLQRYGELGYAPLRAMIQHSHSNKRKRMYQ